MQADRSGLVVPVVLAAWLVGVLWAVSSLGDGDAASGAGASPSASATSAAAQSADASSSPAPGGMLVVEEYDPPRTVTFVEDGQYIGLRLDADGNVLDELPGEIGAGSTALTSRQVNVEGEPYFLLVNGLWADWYMAGDRLELAEGGS